MKGILLILVICFKSVIEKILGDLVMSFIYFIVECFFYFFAILTIIVGFTFIKESSLKKYYGYYSILNGLIVIFMFYLLKSNNNLSIFIWLEKIAKPHGYYYFFLIFIQYIVILVIFNIYSFKEKKKLKQNILKEKEERKTKIKEEKEKIIDIIKEKNRQFLILFVYSEKDEFLRLKKVRLQEIASKNIGMRFIEVNIDNRSDEEFKENYGYLTYPFVALLKENEIVYKKEGMFKLNEIEKILRIVKR